MFGLRSGKGNPLPSGQGTLLGMVQGKTNPWLQVLRLGVRATWRSLPVAPGRSGNERAERLGLTGLFESRVKPCRIVKEICRLRLVGARHAEVEIASALHTFRITLFPWIPLI